MSKSLAAKKAAKKQRTRGRADRRQRERAVVTPWPPKPRLHIGAEPLRRIAGFAGFEQSSFARDKGGSTERASVVAVMEDGQRFEREAIVEYEEGERERAVEASFTDKDRAMKMFESLLLRRSRALQQARGELQREYGKGVPR